MPPSTALPPDPEPTSSVAALLLGDGRFPSGGHAHSGGLEPLVDAGLIADVDDLERFLVGRLATAGSVAAAIAAAACAGNGSWAELQAEADARTVSPAQRAASRSQGRQLLRAARAIWDRPRTITAAATPSAVGPGLGGVEEAVPEGPSPGRPELALEEAVPEGPHHAVALGATAAVAGLGPADAARLAAYGSVAGPASAAVRLLGLDPFAVHAVLARMAPAIDTVAVEAAAAARGPLEDLPCPSAPMLDIAAERHLEMGVRLFAS